MSSAIRRSRERGGGAGGKHKKPWHASTPPASLIAPQGCAAGCRGSSLAPTGRRSFCDEPDNCTVIQTGYGQQDLIAFCPKHKTAPEMYEALKEWSALDEVMKECGYCADDYIECDIHQGQLQQIIKMRDAALLKAEGREE